MQLGKCDQIDFATILGGVIFPSVSSGAIERRYVTICNHKLVVVMLGGVEYLIGVHVAKLLKKETFNLYRSFKVKNIQVVRASNTELEWCLQARIVKKGTRSVTFVPYYSAKSFVEDEYPNTSYNETASYINEDTSGHLSPMETNDTCRMIGELPSRFLALVEAVEAARSEP